MSRQSFGDRVAPSILAAAMTGNGPNDDLKAEEGFTLLFNAKDPSGWTYNKEPLDGKTKIPERWLSVVDSVIVARVQGNGGIRNLYTRKQLEKSLRLRLRFRAGAKADNGVYPRRQQLQVRNYIRQGEQKQLDSTVIGNGQGVTTVKCLCNGEKLDVVMRVPRTGPVRLQAEYGNFKFHRIQIKIME